MNMAKFSFLDDVFPFLSPFSYLTRKRDSYFEFTVRCLMCSSAQFNVSRSYMEYLLTGIQISRKGYIFRAETNPMLLDLIQNVETKYDEVLFWIMAVLDFLQSKDFKKEKMIQCLGV